MAAAASIIERGCQLDGRLDGPADAIVNGAFSGDMQLIRLVVGVDGAVEGSVVCRDAEIFGRLNGHIRCDTVILHPGSSFVGIVEHRRLHVAAGAAFEGRSIPVDGAAPDDRTFKAVEAR